MQTPRYIQCARFCLGMLLFSLLVACTPQETIVVPFDISQTRINSEEKAIYAGQFIAGAATVDITPPPGSLPRAGYATWSNIGEGFRTRLYARVYYLRDAEGDSYLLVQTDLATGSRVLHTKLGAALAAMSDIDASNLTITATHSHSAPGQIVGSQFYNKHISHVSGFAEDYFEFLLMQITAAASEAIASSRPAKMATGHIDIWGVTRNRSIQAHVENDSIQNKSVADSRTFHSINPTMYMVRLDTIDESGNYQPLGAFASFSIHGTALPSSETLFNADVWAYIHKDWELAVKRTNPMAGQVHVSAFEGTHGDVAPATRFDMLGYIEARRVGKEIAQQTISLYQNLAASLTAEVDLQTAIRYVNIREQNEVDGVSICQDAAAGMTLAAAPLEHTSPVIGYLPFFMQGSRRWGDEIDNCQGRKRILGFSWGQPLLEPKDSFPDYVNFQLVRLNDLVIAPYPFEITVESGRRLAADIQQSFSSAGKPVRDVMVTSLAGGYTGYVTTPEEYGRQYYEGGHTIYGKNTLPFLQAHTRRLAKDMNQQKSSLVDLPEAWQYRFEVKKFLPKAEPALGQREEILSPVYSHAHTNEEGRWRFQWRDVAPGTIQLHQPLLSIESRHVNDADWQPLVHDDLLVNDAGYDMGVRLEKTTDDLGMAVYTGYWFNPLFRGEDYEYRFVVQARGGLPVFYSSVFQ